jgi:hypothetical protein
LIRPRVLFPLAAILLVAARLCHSGILWAEESLPLAAAVQMLAGKMLYRDIWFDKPPLLALVYLLWDARTGVILRLAGAGYALVAVWAAWRFARDLWGPREGALAGGLMAFFLTFGLPAATVPLASDLLMLAPHIVAVWLAWKGRPFWSGALAGLAFLLNPKGLFILFGCAAWNTGSWLALGAGFASGPLLACAWLAGTGALHPYYDQVWKWGRLYAGETFVAHPVANGIVRTLHWAGFHAAVVVAAAAFWLREAGPRRRWIAWGAISFVAVAMGWRFFPRYFFQILPVFVLAGARGLAQPEYRVRAALLLLLVPLARFGPRYVMLAAGNASSWTDVAMDQDSRQAARRLAAAARPGETLFVWGFRPELYAYTRMRAGAMYLDSQPLTGVPADRHLTQSEPVETESARARRRELAQTAPAWIADGLGPYNPRLAIAQFPELREWMRNYREAARTGHTILYKRITLAN